MKIKSYIYLLIASVAFTTSCSKSFLQENPPNGVAITIAIATDNDMSDAVNGMYSAMRSTSFFGRDIPVLGDLLADNVYVSFSNSGRYLTETNYTLFSTNGEASDIFTQGYYIILQANRIINSGITSDITNQQLKGEAYTARALTYLEMVNFFGQPYTVAPTALGVPIVKGFTGPFVYPARNTVSDVYKQIISDLDSAYLIMPTTNIAAVYHPTNSEYIGKYAAKAIESRAYLYKGDYPNALAAALTVIQSGTYSLVTSGAFAGYWANPSAQAGKTATTPQLETIFELALTTLTNNGFNGLDDIYSPAGYGDLLCTDGLYALYSATDVRKGLIIPTTRAGQPALVVNKYPNFSNSNEKDDLKMIRYSEVLLIAAEAYANTGDNTNAQLYLNMLMKQRDPSFAGYTDTGAALINDIVTERRKELAFEGLRLFDLDRLNLPIVRPAEPFGYATLTPIPAGSNLRLLPIPVAETNANPNVLQNPGY